MRLSLGWKDLVFFVCSLIRSCKKITIFLGNCEKFVLSLDPLVPKDTSYLPDGGESTFEVKREDIEESVDLLYNHFTRKADKYGVGPDLAKYSVIPDAHIKDEEEEEKEKGKDAEDKDRGVVVDGDVKPVTPVLTPRAEPATSLRDMFSKPSKQPTADGVSASPKNSRHSFISKPGKLPRKTSENTENMTVMSADGGEEEGKKKKAKGGELREMWEQKKEVWKAEVFTEKHKKGKGPCKCHLQQH